jgi:predicted dehydrogenase
MTRTRLAIIGAGAHAQRHYEDPELTDSSRIELCAACDLDKQKLDVVKKKYSIPHVYRDYHEMLDSEDLDAVVIVLRPMEMTPVALDCIHHKKHVLIEKPPGCNASDARRILLAADSQGVKAMVSVNRRFFPIVRYLKDNVIKDQPIVYCSATYNKHGFVGSEWTWPSHLTVADAIHTIDLICHFGGPAVDVRSFAAMRNATFVNSVSAIAKLASGGFATINNHQCSGYRKQLFEVHTERVSAYLDISDESSPRVELYIDNNPQDLVGVYEQIGTRYSEHLHFAEWINGKADPIADLRDVLHSVELAEAAASGHDGPLRHDQPANDQ